MKGLHPENGKIANCIVKAFLTAYAFLTVFHKPLESSLYETKIDFAIASVYELLGEYDFTFVLLLIVCGFFYYHINHEGRERKGNVFTAVFFGLCVLLAGSYHEIGNWDYCFGSVVNFLKFALALAGYAVFFKALMDIIGEALEKGSFTTERNHFFSRNPFRKSFLIIMAAYSPFLLLSFPGNLCWDVIGQIEQVTLQSGYSTHHPLLHTFLVGGLTQLGMTLFGSYEVGLFIYICLQTALLAATMAFSITVLAKRKADFKVLLCLLLLYAVTPIYSNLASTALKDIPFTAFVIVYLIFFAQLTEAPQLIRNRRFVVTFVLLQIGVILFRNNGLPLVLLSGVGGFVFSFKKYRLQERIKSLLAYFGAGVMLGSLVMTLLAAACGATSGSKGEMLSVFFQQTARYLQFYRTEITVEEQQAIEAVLGDVNEVAAKYDPDISDPVKALFKKEASTEEIAGYLGAWFRGFFKHPAVYAEAFLAHIYGWFAPNIENTIRYETDYEYIHQGGLFPNASKMLIFYYRFANRFSLLGVLENIGMAVWALCFYTNHYRRHGQKACVASSLPLWVSLLICMASPCFFGHPRYALPILIGIPFLYGFAMSKSNAVAGEK